MELIADGLLIATALTAALYCLVLSRRLRKLNDSGTGIGEQIARLNAALEETRGALAETRSSISELKGQARTATEKLSREVWLANQTIGEIEKASEQARETLTRMFEADPPPPAATDFPPAAETAFEGGIDEFDPLSEGEDPFGRDGFEPLGGSAANGGAADGGLPEQPYPPQGQAQMAQQAQLAAPQPMQPMAEPQSQLQAQAQLQPQAMQLAAQAAQQFAPQMSAQPVASTPGTQMPAPQMPAPQMPAPQMPMPQMMPQEQFGLPEPEPLVTAPQPMRNGYDTGAGLAAEPAHGETSNLLKVERMLL